MGARRVLVTGAEGTIGTAVREHLAGRFELVSLTLTPQDFASHVADISDLDAIRPAFENVDAVVHLAASASLETPWDDVLHNNIVGTYNVFEAAREAGVERVVFATTEAQAAERGYDARELFADLGRPFDERQAMKVEQLAVEDEAMPYTRATAESGGELKS